MFDIQASVEIFRSNIRTRAGLDTITAPSLTRERGTKYCIVFPGKNPQ